MSAVTKEINSIIRVAEARLAELMGFPVELWMRPGRPKVEINAEADKAYNDVVTKCCFALKVGVKDVATKDKRRELNDARIIISHILTREFRITREKVGSLINGCDHSTTTTRLKTYAALIDTDKEFQRKANLCEQALTENHE
jgi:chromosomal replication initiation ATPase DnaA